MSGAVPLEKKVIRIQYNGVWEDIPALHKTWISEDRAFPRYMPPPVPDGSGCYPVGLAESWLELVTFIQEDLNWLLNAPHHKFWSQIIYHKQTLLCLNSFLQEAPPGYSPNVHSNEDINKNLRELSRLVFLIFCRLSKSRETKQDYMTCDYYVKLIYDNYVFTIPGILDLCAVYGLKNDKAVAEIVHNVFTVQAAYMKDLSAAVPHLTNILKNAKSRCEQPDTNADFLLHVYDAVATMEIFLNIFPSASELFATPNFLNNIASFYTSVIPVLMQHDHLIYMCNILRVSCLKLTRHIFAFILDRAIQTHSLDKVELYLMLISEIMAEGLFICDYHSAYQLDSDLDILVSIHPDIDSLKIDYILEALSSYIELPKLAKPVSNQKTKKSDIENYPSCSNIVSAKKKKVTGIELESLVTEVQDVLPNLGSSFIKVCLDYYDYNTERVIAAVLENTLPSSLEEKNWSEESGPNNECYYAFDDALDGNWSGHVGKKKEKYKNLNQMLSDKKELEDLRERFSTLGYVEESGLYEDEYDDTYEEDVSTVREPDALDKIRRPFVVPRILRGNEETEEEEYEEEEVEVKNDLEKRDLFIQNPEEIRNRMEARRAEKMHNRPQGAHHHHRDVVGKPKGQGQDQQTIENRSHKKVHKAAGGNHHRKDRSSRKRNPI